MKNTGCFVSVVHKGFRACFKAQRSLQMRAAWLGTAL